MRAIPWVFSWSLARIMLPGFYGFGAAVDAFLARHGAAGLERLRAMNARWPFFRTMLANMDMVLGKSDLGIAARYVELVPDVALREAVFGRIRDEWSTAVAHLKAITRIDQLLATNPALQRNFRERTPYIDPLNHVQIELLRRYRAGDTDERIKQGILLTINGIAAGLRNSG
jgi:phosphoenolpyruvate carboxylase